MRNKSEFQMSGRVTKVLGALIVLVALAGYLGYLARLTYSGYCHAQGKYLTDNEKIRVAVADVLTNYPPSVILRKHHPDAAIEGYLPPENPIFYRDVDDFLRLNPDCCNISHISLYKGGESTVPRFFERATGGVSSFFKVSYTVRYLDSSRTEKSNDATEYYALSNCGVPVRWWNPLYSEFYFIYQLLKH